MGCVLSEPKEVANAFNEYLKNIIVDIGNQIDANRVFLKPFQPQEMINLITLKLKSKSSCGANEIPTSIIKKSIPFIAEQLTYLVNLSFTTCKFPTSLKIGKVTPVFKKGNPSLIDNYRPITQLSGISKIFEYGFLERLSDFIYKIMYLENQFGFREGTSTDLALQSYYNRILTFLNNGECPVGIFCDLSRAFDCVNHERLIDKLNNMGIRGTPLAWVKSFLRDRIQYVSMGYQNGNSKLNATSSTNSVSIGVS